MNQYTAIVVNRKSAETYVVLVEADDVLDAAAQAYFYLIDEGQIPQGAFGNSKNYPIIGLRAGDLRDLANQVLGSELTDSRNEIKTH